MSESEFSTAEQAFRALGREYVELTLHPTTRGPMTLEAAFQNRLSMMVYKFGLDRDLKKYLNGIVGACQAADRHLSATENFQWRLATVIKGALGPVREARYWETQPIPKGGKRYIGFNDHLDAAYATDLVTVDEKEDGSSAVRLHQLKVSERGGVSEKVENSLFRMRGLLSRLVDREKYFESASKKERARFLTEAREAIKENAIDHVVIENAELLEFLFAQDPPKDISEIGSQFLQEIQDKAFVPEKLMKLINSGRWEDLCQKYLEFTPSQDERSIISQRLPKWNRALKNWVADNEQIRENSQRERWRKEGERSLIDTSPGNRFEAVIAVYDDRLRRHEKARVPLGF